MAMAKKQEQQADWLVDLRDRAGRAFDLNGLPSKKVEEWSYTTLKGLKDVDFTPHPQHGKSVDKAVLPDPLLNEESEIEAARIVVINGVYRADLSDTTMLPPEVTITSLDQALEEKGGDIQSYMNDQFTNRDQALFALNSHFFTDGLYLHVPESVTVKHPIELLSFCEGDSDTITATYPRHMFIAETGSEVTILEHLCGEKQYFKNAAYDIVVGDGAKMHHYRWQDEALDGGQHISTSNITLGKTSTYDGFTLNTGAPWARNTVEGWINGDDSNLRVNGAYLLKGKQHNDTTIVINHDALNGVSNQTFKGILDDRSKGVFQGKIFVHKDAQKTDGYQLNNAILLSNKAEVDCKPELEIYADDVKCSHGATTGRIDKDQLFYLMARGIPEKAARRILLQAFVGEALEEITSESIRALFQELANKWLNDLIK